MFFSLGYSLPVVPLASFNRAHVLTPPLLVALLVEIWSATLWPVRLAGLPMAISNLHLLNQQLWFSCDQLLQLPHPSNVPSRVLGQVVGSSRHCRLSLAEKYCLRFFSCPTRSGFPPSLTLKTVFYNRPDFTFCILPAQVDASII